MFRGYYAIIYDMLEPEAQEEFDQASYDQVLQLLECV